MVKYKISISGMANTGKNTLSSILEVQLAAAMKKSGECGWCKHMAFADPIKEIIMIMFPKSKTSDLYGPSKFRNEIIPEAFKDGKPLTYRQALIDIGTGLGRGYNDKIWLNNFEHRYQQITDPTKTLIVSDCRFRNEFDFLKQKGFYNIRLYRDTEMPHLEHVSETLQSEIKDHEFDYVIYNNKTLQDLRFEVKNQIIPQVLKKK